MATITGYTAARMKAIEDSSIVDGEIVGDNLILKRFDGAEIDAGVVKGPQGDPGVQDVAAQISAALNLADPVGVPKPYTGAAAPLGHGLCDAATEYSSATYPILAALYGTGAGCVNGASTVGTFRLPDLKGRVLVGRDASIPAFDTLHETGGSKDASIVNHVHLHDHGNTQPSGDPHTHEISHTHGAESGLVNQIALTEGNAQVAAGGDYAAVNAYSGGTTEPAPDAVSGEASDSEHVHDIAEDSTNPTGGVSVTDKNLPPYRVINYIMRLA